MIVIANGNVVGPRAILENHCVLIEGGVIKQITPPVPMLWPGDAQVVDAAGCFVAPGFVDLHVHGAQGRDTMEASVEALAQIAKFHATGGTTAMTPTLIAGSREQMTAALDAVGQAMGHDFGGAQIVGAHLEGPYLSRAKCGAIPAQWLRAPDPAEYAAWLERDGLVTQMTLAPELPGALELIEALLEKEILPSAGHTAASGDQIVEAVERGLCHATHLFNAMSAAEKRGARREPGAVEALLADDRVMAELIADGQHVHPLLMKLAVRAKGVDRICLVTDATAGAGLADGAEFVIGETRGVVRGGVGMLADDSALAGSTSTMITMVQNAVALAGVTLPEAVRMASLNPARALSVAGRKGSLEPRKDADLVVFTPMFETRLTMVGGRIEFQKS